MMHLYAHVRRLSDYDMNMVGASIGNYDKVQSFMGVQMIVGDTNRITFGMRDCFKWAPRFDT